MLRSIAATAVLTLLSAADARASEDLTLESAVTLALANNERALKAPLRVEAAEGQLDRARSAFLPTLSASTTGTLRAQEDRAGRSLFGQGTVTFSQPLVNLSAFPLYSQARHQLASERWSAAQDKRLVAFDTASAFLVALTNERVLRAAEQRLERARANARDTDARAAAGLTSTNDATRATIEAANAENQVATARGNVARAYIQLGFLVGRPVTGALMAPDRTTRIAQHGAFRVEELLRFAEGRRPDVRAAHERTEALRASAAEPLYRLAPTLGATGQMRIAANPLPTERPHDETAVVTLTWPVFDAGVRYADRKTRIAQAESQSYDEKLLRRSIATDVGIALAALRAARESYAVTEQAVLAAQRNTEETTILYGQGLARAIELTDANATRFDTEVNFQASKLLMEQAYLQLRLALGLDPIGDEFAPGGAPPPAADVPQDGAP